MLRYQRNPKSKKAMLISTPEELRLYSPANAIDHIDTIQGFIDSSEQDFLLEKLGQKLYDALVSYYRDLRKSENGIQTFINNITNGDELPPYARLLSLAQRIVTFDALGRAIDMQAISVHGSGVNITTADDYSKADREAVQSYKATCIKETHAATNALLVALEQWTITPDATEKKEITDLWRSSRFFYLAASLAIPSATVLQEYLNIYDSREKFIAMLPDLRYIQEDIIAPIIGEDFLDYLITISRDGMPTEENRLLLRIIHKLRKAVARHLESRTQQIKVTDPRRETARNEAERLTTDLSEYLAVHQSDLPTAALAAFKSSPLYVPEDDPTATATYQPEFQNNSSDAVMFVTPHLYG